MSSPVTLCSLSRHSMVGIIAYQPEEFGCLFKFRAIQTAHA